MPSKYIAKNPRGSKFQNTDPAVLARQAIARQGEIRDARFRCLTASIRTELRHTPQNHVIDILCGFMQLDELEMIITELRGRRKQVYAVAKKNRDRQAS